MEPSSIPFSDRVVEVLVDNGAAKATGRWTVGSGLLIGKDLVLTAAHVVTSESVLVRVIRTGLAETYKIRWAAEVVISGDPNQLDLALLQVKPDIPTDRDWLMQIPPLLMARIDRSAPIPTVVENCHAAGFPNFQEIRSVASQEPHVREMKGVEGTINVLSRSYSGLVDLLVVDKPGLPRLQRGMTLVESPWAGFSGANVLHINNSQGYLLGAVTEHHPPAGDSCLTFTPITAIELLPAPQAASWWDLLGVSSTHLPLIPAKPEVVRGGLGFGASKKEPSLEVRRSPLEITIPHQSTRPIIAQGDGRRPPLTPAPAYLSLAREETLERSTGKKLRGRDDVVRFLLSILLPDESTRRIPGTRRTRVLCGPPGSGKTCIVNEISSVAEARGALVWRIHAGDRATIDEHMREIGRRIQALGNSVDIIWKRLNELNQPWLLIFDGADDPSMFSTHEGNHISGTGWLREPTSRGLIIVASRKGAENDWPNWCSRDSTGSLDDDDAADVLMDFTSDRAGNRDAAKRLAKQLGCRPLSLRHVGHRLAQSRADEWSSNAIVNFAAYSKVIEDGGYLSEPNAEEMLFLETVYHQPMRQLEGRGFLFARPLVHLLARLADASIPARLILEPSIMRQFTPFAGLEDHALTPTLIESAREYLVRWDQHAEPSTLHIDHPSIRDSSLRDGSLLSGASHFTNLLSCLLRNATELCGDSGDPKTWKIWQHVAHHCVHFLSKGLEDADTATIERALDAATAATEYLDAVGLFAQAEAAARQVVAVRQRLPMSIDNRAAILRMRGLYATTRRDQDSLLEAAELLGKVCESWKELIVASGGVAHEVVRIGWTTDAGLSQLAAVGDSTARGLLSAMLDSYYSLAVTKAYLGWADDACEVEARDIYRSVYEARRRLLGHEHLDTMNALAGMAIGLYNRGDYSEAETHLRAVFACEEASQPGGRHHPDTMNTAGWLAKVLVSKGDGPSLQEAERIRRELVEGHEAVFGVDPRTVDAVLEHADLLKRLNHLEAARRRYQEIIDLEGNQVRDSQLATARHRLASVLIDLGRQMLQESEDDNRD